MRLRFLAGYLLGLVFAFGTFYLVVTINDTDHDEQAVQPYGWYYGEKFELNDWTFYRNHISHDTYELYDMQKNKVGTFNQLSDDEWEIENQEGTTWRHLDIGEETKSAAFQTLSEGKYDWYDLSFVELNLTPDDLPALGKCRFNAIDLQCSSVPDSFWTLEGVTCVERITLWACNVTPAMMREFSKYPNLKTVQIQRCTFCFE